MRLVTLKNTNLGEVLQAYTTDVLQMVADSLGRQVEIQPNGITSAKALFLDESQTEVAYLYLGFDIRGFLICQYMPYMGTGKPRTILGPLSLAKTAELPIMTVARRIVAALPAKL